MTFTECVLECFDNPELVAQFNRLYGCSLGADRRSPIERMVDQAAGYKPAAVDEAEALQFIDFVYECIWSRLPPEAFVQSAV